MARSDDASATTRTTYERESDTRWAHRNLGGAWWLALLAVPLLLAALVAAVKGGDIEDDLGARSTAALSAAGLDDVDLDFSGRDATLSAAEGASLSEADLERAQGIVADIEGVRVADVDTTGLSAGGDEPSATPEPSEEPSESATEEPGAVCEAEPLQEQIDQILGADKITFGEGSSDLEGASADEVAQVGALLVDCADLSITVTGNTDTPGAKSKTSEKRADSVKAALVDAGVDAGAIEVVGARDSQPLGDNSTPEGRDMNRYADIVVE